MGLLEVLFPPLDQTATALDWRARLAAGGLDTSFWDQTPVRVNRGINEYGAELFVRAWTFLRQLSIVIWPTEYTSVPEADQDNLLDGAGEVVFQLPRDPATFAQVRMKLSASAFAATTTLGPGEILIRVGAMAEFSSVETVTIIPGRVTVVICQAVQTGPDYNVGANLTPSLVRELPGVDVGGVVGKGLIVGDGSANGSFRLHAGTPGYSIQFVSPGPSNLSFTVSLSGTPGTYTIGLTTDGAGNSTATADQVVEYLMSVAVGPATPCLRAAQLLGTGSGVVQPTGVLGLPYDGGWLERVGNLKEQNPQYLRRMLAYWDMTHRAGNTDLGLEGWARVKPAGYEQSPVRRVKVNSNIDVAGNPSGAAITIVVAGDNSGVGSEDVVAVRANFENPQKYANVAQNALNVISASVRVIAVVGTVEIYQTYKPGLNNFRTLAIANVRQLERDTDIGQQNLVAQQVSGRIQAVAPTFVKRIVFTTFDGVAVTTFTGPSVNLNFDEIVNFDLTALVFTAV